ncbi:SAVED domain-containing protein [Silvimonas iriomotensis]|uniref:SMODS-associated and fused to various effectors domain-containing protein n=1 Tax=Silvimonas iriomotensis TaxID=449662 RepID=A0ABQ2PA57_9NEIS|nr:SAVED domain-containing protein [Silvimonas iriomotensis]GGP21889.1 hypothetical protein GCM10010970_22710 [Silvimonas iriomotensis]
MQRETAEKFHAAVVLDASTDAELAVFLQAALTRGQPVMLLANAYTVRILTLNDKELWEDKARGDFGQTCFDTIKPLLKKKLFCWVDVPRADLYSEEVVLPEFAATTAASTISRWLKGLNTKNKREGEASPKTKSIVAYRAAWRCQFDGCGADLGTHTASGKEMNVGYYAHIVAASEDGPRGEAVLSAELVDNPDNIMLMCDGCHRLIDRQDPTKYTRTVLNEMRIRSIAKVKGLLDSLTYPPVTVIAAVGNIEGQVPYLSMSKINEALHAAGLRAASQDLSPLFRVEAGAQTSTATDYWQHAALMLPDDISSLKRKLAGLESHRTEGISRPTLAVFGITSTSLLILLGRILGDYQGTHIFQSHRNPASWTWPKDADVPTDDKYKVEILRVPDAGQVPAENACLKVSLTFDIETSRLTQACQQNNNLTIPTIEIKVANPHFNIISHPRDQDLFAEAVDKALYILQDQWKCKRIQLCAGAPVSALVILGQKLQARHHATVVCHEPGQEFVPVMELTGEMARLLLVNKVIDLKRL